jgi:DNA-binding winged helix-turn-helix (wHTH) protein
MRAHDISRDTARMEPAFVGGASKVSGPRPRRLVKSSTRPEPHWRSVQSKQKAPEPRNEMAELVTDIDGLSILVRFHIKNIPAEMQSDVVSRNSDIHSLLSSTLEKMVARMRGSPQRADVGSKQPLAIVELISSGTSVVQLPALPNEAVLRVGPLEVDLINRTAKRGDRQLALLPREFRLLKYMMERSDKLLTRATLLKEVWHYKFAAPETNLVDVHMGRLRRKVDGSNEAALFRTVRGVGFVLSADPLDQQPARPRKVSANGASDIVRAPGDSKPSAFTSST